MILPAVYFYVFFSISLLLYFRYRFYKITDLFIIGTFILASWLNTSLKQSNFYPDTTKIYNIEGRVQEELHNQNYVLSVSEELFYLYNNSTQFFIPGDSVQFTGRIYPIYDNRNTGAFNYNTYLRDKNIFYRIHVLDSLEKKGRSYKFYFFLQEYRYKLNEKIDILIKDETFNSIVKAITIGYRHDLDKSTKLLFTETGTVHLLAVSGLHTGAVYLLISFLFNIFGLHQPKIRLLIIPLLWIYACLTGLPPSVIRAANILTFIIIGKAFERDYTPLNSIAASAFFTLIINPSSLFSLSMQMSYAAYTGIVLFYPLFMEWGKNLNPFFRKLYSVLSVSLAAQIMVIPISVYYFHSFSISSVIINIIAIPLTSILLYISIILLILPSFISLKLTFLINVIGFLIFKSLSLFQNINIILQDLYLPLFLIIMIYIIIILLYRYTQNREKTYLYLIISSFIIILCFNITTTIQSQHRKEITVFNLYGKSCILLNYNGFYTYLKNNTDSIHMEQIKPYLYINKLSSTENNHGFIGKDISYKNNLFISDSCSISIIDNQKLLDCSSETIIVTDNIKPYFILRKEKSNIKKVIVDGSNNNYTILQWKNFCKENNIPYITTVEQGSINIKLK